MLGLLRMTCRRFPHRIENKRFLLYQLERVCEEARNDEKYEALEKEALQQRREEQASYKTLSPYPNLPPFLMKQLGYEGEVEVDLKSGKIEGPMK